MAIYFMSATLPADVTRIGEYMKKISKKIKVPQKAPRTRIAQRPKVQNIDRKRYKRDQSWKTDDADVIAK